MDTSAQTAARRKGKEEMRRPRFIAVVVIGLASLGLIVSQATAAAAPTSVTVGARAVSTIHGYGSRVVAIRFARSTPMVVTARHSGQSNFIVHMVGPTTCYLFNEIGSYLGQRAETDVKAGRYRVAVQADGSWSIAFAQPTPPKNARILPGTISSHGDRVIAVRTKRNLQPIVTATHTGESNFVVHIIGYGTMTGEELLFNEIGSYHGQYLMENLPRGTYLLAVQGDGSWTVRFAP